MVPMPTATSWEECHSDEDIVSGEVISGQSAQETIRKPKNSARRVREQALNWEQTFKAGSSRPRPAEHVPRSKVQTRPTERHLAQPTRHCSASPSPPRVKYRASLCEQTNGEKWYFSEQRAWHAKPRPCDDEDVSLNILSREMSKMETDADLASALKQHMKGYREVILTIQSEFGSIRELMAKTTKDTQQNKEDISNLNKRMDNTEDELLSLRKQVEEISTNIRQRRKGKNCVIQ